MLFVSMFFPARAVFCQDDLIWIRDHQDDWGDVPSVSWPPMVPDLDEFWNSPDIWTVPEYPRTGTPCTVFATVRNKTAHTVRNTEITFFFDNLSTAASFPSLYSETIGVVTLPVIPALGEEEVSIEWTPPAEGNFCGEPFWTLGVTLNTVGDPQQSDWALWDNNVAVKSVRTSIQPPGGDPERSSTVFLAGNPNSYPDTVMISVDRRQIPAGWQASIDFPENERFFMQPETLFPVTLTVIPDENSSVSDSGTVLIEQFLASSPYRGLEIGMGMTEVVTVTGTTIDLEKTDVDSLIYTVEITNHTDKSRIIDYWIWAETPGGSIYPANPLIMAEDAILPGGWSGTRSVSHVIPPSAPPGLYSYIAVAGAWPDTVFDWDFFNFDVE